MKFSTTRVLVLLFISALVLSPSRPSLALSIPDKYDQEIQRVVKRWWPDLPHWKLWKAQLFIESGLNPNAVSPVGARGLAQFMPRTFSDISQRLGIVASPNDDAAIEAGAYYMATLRRGWRGRMRTPLESHALGQAAYNSGMKNVLAAQEICNDERLWPQIAPCMLHVTGAKNAAETIGYVQKIDKFWKKLELE